MALTAAQKTSLKNAIAANTTAPGGNSAYTATPINQIPNNGDGNQAIADWYNIPASTNFFVWNSAAPIASVYDNVTWANLTPTDAVPTTAGTFASVSEAVLVWHGRSLACQGKQFNLQTILIGSQGTINGTKSNIRAGLQDALTNVPSGVNGGTVAAGWTSVRDNVLSRKATNAEKLLADTTNGNGSSGQTSAFPAFDGTLSAGDVDAARNS
jgi:hypothetical protein